MAAPLMEDKMIISSISWNGSPGYSLLHASFKTLVVETRLTVTFEQSCDRTRQYHCSKRLIFHKLGGVFQA